MNATEHAYNVAIANLRQDGLNDREITKLVISTILMKIPYEEAYEYIRLDREQEKLIQKIKKVGR